MSYDYSLRGAFRVKEEKTYPWPCQPQPDRTIKLFPFDVLTKDENGTVTKHTGLCMVNIHVPDEDLEPIEGDLVMSVGSMLGA